MTMIDGKTVADCFALVARYGIELNALHETLENLLSEQLTIEKSLPCVLVGNTENKDRFDDSGWVANDQACSIPLKSTGKGNKSIEKYLGFQISMTGDGINILGNEEPLLHIFCWGIPINFDDKDYIGFPLEDDADYPHEILNECLISWGSWNGSWCDKEWTYSLRLLSINSIDDLKKYVVNPALALLKGANIDEVLLKEWLDKTLIRYRAPLNNPK